MGRSNYSGMLKLTLCVVAILAIVEAVNAQGFGGGFGGRGFGGGGRYPQAPPGLTDYQRQEWKRGILNLRNYTAATLTAINKARREMRLPPLHICKSLHRAAYTNSKRLSDLNIGWDDQRSVSLAVKEGYKRQNVGVFVVTGPNQPNTVVNMMKFDARSKPVLKNRNFTYCGVGLYLKAPEQSYGYVWTLYVGRYV